MKSREEKFIVSAMSLAVRAALLAICVTPVAALADDAANDELNALINPTNTIDIGGLYVGGKESPKFGEYNGLDKDGGYFIGNFNLRGGDSYGMGEGIRRYEVYGTDLGTTSRSLGAGVSDQGRWNLSVDFDQLRHYTTGGTYQTPYQGSAGDNVFTLPPSFTTIATQAVPGTRNLSANQQSFFHTEDVYSERKNASVKAGYAIDRQWGIKFDFSHVVQDGAKLMGAATDLYAIGGGFTYRGQNVAIVMNPTEYKTDNLNLAVDWNGDKGFMSVGYYGSFFRDEYNGLSFSNPFVSTANGSFNSPGAGGFPLDTLSTAPNNDFHQLNLTGGYNFSSATKLVGGLSYGRNTQNSAYAGTYTTAANGFNVVPDCRLPLLTGSSSAPMLT